MTRTVNVRLDFSKAELTPKAIAEANKRGEERYSGSEHPEDFLLWDFTAVEETKDQADDVLSYSWELSRDDEYMVVYIQTPLGTIDVEIPMKLDVQLTLLENLIKKANKVKTILEAVS